MTVTQKDIKIDDQNFLTGPYGIYGKKFWPLRFHEAEEILNSLPYFAGNTVEEYFANCGFEVSGIIYSFFTEEHQIPDVVEYLYDHSYHLKDLWESEDMASYLLDQDVCIGRYTFDWNNVEEKRQKYKEKVSLSFHGWTLTDVFLSALSCSLLSKQEPALCSLLEWCTYTPNRKLKKYTLLNTQLENGEIEAAYKTLTDLETYRRPLTKLGNYNRAWFFVKIVKWVILNRHLFFMLGTDFPQFDKEFKGLLKGPFNKIVQGNQQVFTKVFKQCALRFWSMSSVEDSPEERAFSGGQNLQNEKVFQEYRKDRILFCFSLLEMPLTFQNDGQLFDLICSLEGEDTRVPAPKKQSLPVFSKTQASIKEQSLPVLSKTKACIYVLFAIFAALALFGLLLSYDVL